MKNIIVQLRIYRGKVTYDANRKITSDVQTMKLKYGRLEWANFLKSAKIVYSKIDIIRCTDMDNDYKEIETPSEVISDVKKALESIEVTLTPQQQEIKDLKDAVTKLQVNKESKKEEKKEESKPKEESSTDDSKDELETLREKYTELYGKKPSHLMREKGLKAKIEEKS